MQASKVGDTKNGLKHYSHSISELQFLQLVKQSWHNFVEVLP